MPIQASENRIPSGTSPSFQAGAASVDITPRKLPVIVNGDFFERYLDQVDDPLSVRALVLDDGRIRIAMVVVDSCLIPADIYDKAKGIASRQTGIPTNRLMFSATHCHSAPSVLGVLGSGVDQEYAAWLPGRIAEAVIRANARLEEAAWGFATDADPEHVFCRRFIMKPGTAWTENQAFTGSPGDIAQMNPEGKQADIVCPTGQPDPTVCVLAVTRKNGAPLAVLGNYSTHYVGTDNISADYFSVFSDRIAEMIGVEEKENFLGILCNGTSGDTNCIDFRNPQRTFDRFSVGESVARAGARAYRKIVFSDNVSLDMLEEEMTFSIRKPTREQVALAHDHLKKTGDRQPITREDVYARETLLVDALPDSHSLKIQAIRIGSLGIVAIPCEVYSATGREIRGASPFPSTFVISNANGASGYLPTEDSFRLGGYTTWRARSSLLEEEAERKIRLASLSFLGRLFHRIT